MFEIPVRSDTGFIVACGSKWEPQVADRAGGRQSAGWFSAAGVGPCGSGAGKGGDPV